MDHQSALNRYGTMFMAASMAIALFVATQAIAAPDHGIASRYAAWAGGLPAPSGETVRQVAVVR